MNAIIFNSERRFTVFDMTSSHGQLLLRSQKTGENLSNIDVIFFDTTYIQLFTNLNGILIKIADKTCLTHYSSVTEYLQYPNNYLFEIESTSEKFYVAASFLKVFENELDFSETSLNYENFGREKEIAKSKL